ncbi:signal transduction histidine kinase [Luteimonas cucumeris]|uniref:Signal transduction histidine kinase n=1 Tax=Luteimonas cucumeris TaxID=985012 RepID=A0A562L866_9GAMM|nr:sensor histidine kinase [Luteimonas cucumeris]TWI03840.1 signal transduction histidine kinase [Luteimonas cucumeris]
MAWPRTPDLMRSRLGATGVGYACGLLGQVASHALFVRPAEITSIWLPGGLVMAFLICRPPGRWPYLLAGFVLGGVCAFALRSGMVVIPLLGYLWLSACMAAGAATVKLVPGQVTMFPTISHLVRFFLYVVVGVSCACASGFIGVVSLIRDDVAMPRLWVLSTTAYAVAFMLITPLAVDLIRSRFPPWRDIGRQVIGFALFSIGLWILSILAWHAVPSNLSSVPLALFAPIPLLMLAAFQFGRFGPSVGLIIAFLPAIVIATRLDKADTFEVGLVNSYIMQLWTLACGVLVHALAIQARQRNDILQRLSVTSEENKSLAARLMLSQEEQSIRLSRELHDGVNQKLTFFSIALSALKLRSPVELHPPIEELTTGVRGLIDEVREISHSLHPAALEHAGLAGALDDLVRMIDGKWEGEIALMVEIDPDANPLTGENALCFYRVAQEAIRNAVQHSGARGMKIMLVARSNRWRLRVSDNGRGFAPDGVNVRSGLGLLSMRERVKSADGRLYIRSRPEFGTSITVEMRA